MHCIICCQRSTDRSRQRVGVDSDRAYLPLKKVRISRRQRLMRCGTWIVTSEATVAELVQKCGEPASKEVSTADVYAKGPQANQTRKVGVTTTERWTYDRGPQAFRMIATIVDGKLNSIDRAK